MAPRRSPKQASHKRPQVRHLPQVLCKHHVCAGGLRGAHTACEARGNVGGRLPKSTLRPSLSSYLVCVQEDPEEHMLRVGHEAMSQADSPQAFFSS